MLSDTERKETPPFLLLFLLLLLIGSVHAFYNNKLREIISRTGHGEMIGNAEIRHLEENTMIHLGDTIKLKT